MVGVPAETKIEHLPGASPFTNPLLVAIKGPINIVLGTALWELFIFSHILSQRNKLITL
jgi:hypothetical protein